MIPSAYKSNYGLTNELLPRRLETRRRVEILNGTYPEHLKDTALRLFGKARLKGIGQITSVRNPLDQIASSHSVQYIKTPLVTGLEEGLADLIGDHNSSLIWDLYKEAGGAPMPSKMATVGHACQKVWVVANDCAIIVERGAKGIILRHVDPSVLEGEQAQDNPGQPVILRWERRRKVKGKWETTTDEWDISNPEEPTFKVLLTGLLGSEGDYDSKDDITDVFFKTPMSGKAYPWRWTLGERKGEPYIPAWIYHAHLSPDLWTPYRHIELVDGTLVAGVMWTFFIHCFFDASWPQRWGINVKVNGLIPNSDGSSGVVTDPSVFMIMEKILKDQDAKVGQFKAGADPEMLNRSIDNFTLQLESSIVAVDITSTGGDPLEQIAKARKIVIANYDTICREGDAAILEICAAIANNWKKTAYPESDYGLLYRDDIDSVLAPRSAGEE